MPTKKNPLNLNPLQLKTLTLLQALSQLPDHARPGAEPGSVLVTNLPHPHGDHFHVGTTAMAARDASGLTNQSVWVALERKGLIKGTFPYSATLTELGVAYDTGLHETLFHHSAH